MMISGASESPIDAQGRILVPPVLREYARLERETIFVGVGPRIELWDKARFDANLQKTQARFARFLRRWRSWARSRLEGGGPEEKISSG